MTTCPRCGHEAAGAYCGNCGAAVDVHAGSEDATRTASTQQAPQHSEGWQDSPTYASAGGYESYRRTSSHPSNSPYQSAAPTGAGAASPERSNKRGNQMLATLVGVAAVAVFALVAYLFLKPGNDHKSSSATSANPSVATSSSGSSAPSQSSSSANNNGNSGGNQAQPAPATTYVTPSASPSAGGSDNSGGGSTTSWGSIANLVDQSGDFGVSQSGSTATVYKNSGSGPQAVSTLHLNGHMGTGVHSEKLSFIDLPGCQSPILVWNAGADKSSGAFGDDGSGNYQLFANAPGGDLAPNGGDGSAANERGVHAESDRGHIAFTDIGADRDKSNLFDSCESDGTTLHFAGQGH